ncbi:MAG: FmdB family transcriptional regulator [Candidatus Omnitrophica bacterium]|nr:FmdB family transcriptional regulator [Candidatus Omnitrophota bacterium]
MPTYEYECANCNKIFEIFQKMSDKALDKCPKCHKKISRLIGGGSGIIFKGSGFYATDYRKSSNKSSSSKQKPGPCSSNKEGCSACPHAH